MGEAADAASDVGSVAAVLRCAKRGAAGGLVLGPWHKQPPLAGPDQHGGGRRGGGRGRGACPIVMVLMGEREREREDGEYLFWTHF